MQSSDDIIINQALAILSKKLRQPGIAMSSPKVVKQFLTMKLMLAEREVFGVIWLNAMNEVIACEDLFFGTLTSAGVHPREIIKSALSHNAAGLICYHNHPSGKPDPSDADKRLTKVLVECLRHIDVKLLDHIIVGGLDTYSFAENYEI